MKTQFNQLLALFTFSALLLSGCYKLEPWPSIKGEGPMVRDTYQMGYFDGVQVDVNAFVRISQGSETRVEILGQENILDILDVRTINNVLVISFDVNVWKYEKLQIDIEVPDLNLISSMGSADIHMITPLVTDNLSIDIFGSGTTIIPELSAEKLTSRIHGSGNIEVGGSVETEHVSINGSGNFYAFDLFAAEVRINIFGSGNGNIFVSNSLDASIHGSGSVFFKGNPQVSTTSIFGSGKVVKVN
ncbi:MAG: DUF2807 domain-containing protein [Bacteroidales bacterium]|nr:DUF2807 domain-containing protein [Bacteroidales bacterium]